MFEIAIVLLLIVINGAFSLSELAVVSSRRTRLRSLAEAHRPGAAAALELAEDPGRFLSTVQIGITLVGVLAGAFSGSTLGSRLAVWLASLGVPAHIAEPVGFGVVVAIVTYFSIVIGELVPKRLALSNAEGLACVMAPAMRLVSRIAAPLVWLLDASTGLIFRLLGRADEGDALVTEDDVRSLVAEAEQAGSIETAEKHMIAGVLRLGDRSVRGLMTPKSNIEWLDLTASEAEQQALLAQAQHSHLPVGDGSLDALVGVLRTRDLLANALAHQKLEIRQFVRAAPVLPDSTDALDALAALRAAEVPVVLVHDEYGHFEGLITPADLLQVIAGTFQSDRDAEPGMVAREDGSWLLAGWLPVDELADQLGLQLPSRRDYHTVAGLVLSAFGRLPAVGEAETLYGWRFEVLDLDGRRIDKVLATPAPMQSATLRRPGQGA